ncbi:fibronectin type III domain-containing protein, partial [Candidatus Woesearchaeota archaeon]|nr:fibronectin type III domain-containing protein [Candidatus Woesearchaeota archaeon]
FVAGKDTSLPFINLSIPRYISRRIIDITGSTKPFSSVTLFVNNMNIPIRSLSGNEVGSSGKFVFSQIQLMQDNLIKIVMVDKYGNKNQKTFEASIDTENPAVKLNEIPSATSKPNLTISGSVNEPVTLKVFVNVNANDSSVPSQVIGLNATRVGQNSVELRWDESTDNDFSHYVVYREDASPIAVTKPANFNLFIDALVDSGKRYTYHVSAVNIFGNEGPKSGPVTVTTLSGGAVLNLKPAEVDILEDFRKPLLVANVTGNFNFGIKLGKGDQTYYIKLIFEDRAGNSVLFEKNVLLDTKKPQVKITSPPGGALVFENVANEIDIIGKTKPNARVHLFVDRTPFTAFNETFEVTSIPPFLGDEIQNIPEAQLDAKCRFNVAAKSFCRTGADFSINADEQGNFKFEKVDMTAAFGGAARLMEVSPTELRDTLLNEEARQSKNVKLLVIATDPFGQRGFATQTVRIGTCWSGNQSWNIIPLTKYQSPTLLSTERIAEGTETIYFYFNYTYIGRGHDGKITSISLSKACGTKEVLDPRFNISCQIMSSGNGPTKLNSDGTLSYSALTLSRLPGMDSFLENDWKGFFKAINKELTFPFKIRITYEHEVIDTDGQSRRVKETQTACDQVTYVVDNAVIDPTKVLPDWLLYDFVDWLQGSIKTLTDAQHKVDQVLNYVAFGCIASGGLNLALQFFRRFNTIVEEKAYAVLNSKTIGALSELMGIGKIKLNPENKEDEQYCQGVITKIVNTRGTFKFKYVNDIDLKRCFPDSAALWEREAAVYSWMRWSCDRVFGHAAPAAWTEAKDDTELFNRVMSGEGCAVDQSVRGMPLRAESCIGLIDSTFKGVYKDAYNLGDKCFKVQLGQKRAMFKLGELVSDNLYEIEFVPGSGALIEINYAIKRDEFNYITAQQKTCAEICGVKEKPKAFTGPGGATFEISKTKPANPQPKPGQKPKADEVELAGCSTVDTCRSVGADGRVYVTDDKGVTQERKVTSFETRGFTSDCFYGPGKSYSVVSDRSTAQRVECCCINSKKGAPTKYYQPDDKDTADQSKSVHLSKTVPGQPPQPKENDQKGYSDVEWSYRYWKEKFEAQGADGQIYIEYNPNRYIKGRDQSACFGQNNIFYDGFSKTDGKVLVVDPFRDHAAAFQCLHIAGISNRIQFVKNLMASLSTCLIQVRTTGRGNAGACKELFTQHLCGAIWQVVRAFADGCAPIGTGVNLDLGDKTDTVGTYLRAGFQGVTQSISDLQSSTAQEYGNAKLNELLGTGEEDVARKICLGAFGYGWEFNIRNLVDAAYASPFATLVQPVTRSREFLTVDPVSLKPKYEYRASWVINPGCDFERYDVYLTCVGRKQLDQYPNSVNCGAIGAPSIGYTGAIGSSPGYSQCDCINKPDEQIGPLVLTGRLKQNILEDKKAFNKVVESNYRYDHLKFVLRPDRKITPRIKPSCFPQGF